MEEKNEVVQSFSTMLTDKLDFVHDALPKDFNKTRFVQNSLAVLNGNPGLAKINKNEVAQGLLKAAYLGLDFSNNECYLIPYGNSVQFQTSYKGEVKFVKRYSIRKIKDVYAKVVRKGDEFEETIIDGHPSINFKPIPFSGEEIVGAFAVVNYEDGGMDYETMSTEDINGVRNNYSKASMSKAWKNSFGEMSKKTVLRRLCKHIETDFETVEAHNAWEDGAGVEFNNTTIKQEPGQPVDIFAENDEITVTEIVEEDLNEMPMPDAFK